MAFARKSSGTVIAYEPARWTTRAWGVIAYLAVLVAVAGIVVFAVRYQPLLAANFASGPVAGSNGKTIRAEYANGGVFSFGFLLVNNGALPVKIQRIQVSGDRELLIPEKVEMAPKSDAGSLSEADPSLQKFVSFSLAANDRRWIVVRMRFGNCGRFPAGSFETYTQFKVTYTVAGFTKHAWVSLPKSIRVDSPSDADCPIRAG